MEGLVVLVGAIGLLTGMILNVLWNKMETHYYWENRGNIWNSALTMRQTALVSVRALEESLEQLDQSVLALNDHTLEVLIGAEFGRLKVRVQSLKKRIPTDQSAEMAAQVREQNKQLLEYGEMFTRIWTEAMELRIRLDSTIAIQVETVKNDHAEQAIAEASVS